ncbi:MAG: hypothetical protein ACOYEF_06495 [Planifilum sp.]|jgi:hypothetical protein|nr:hypothetical protein [Bacillota bacterium]MBO2534103.1 hypothetical protein [Thermoactinomycetaceae bacterium]
MIKDELIMALAGMAFAILFLALGTVLFNNWIKTRHSKGLADKSEKHERMVAKAVELQKETLRNQNQMAEDIAGIKERLASIEKILKEVE